MKINEIEWKLMKMNENDSFEFAALHSRAARQ